MDTTTNILYVEDHDDARDLLSFLLKQEGFQVTTCKTPVEGLELAQANRFSAIVLDNYLTSDISGIEVCRRIRAFDKDTPIIFYSAAAFPHDREAGLAAGAHAYLVKPHDFEKIIDTLRDLLSPMRRVA